jgi:membrane protein insertase Oxa1/YidC/SpoIIIJ
MERFWNLIYYFAYKGDYKLHLLFNKINPVLLLYKFNFSKRRFAKMGIDNPVEELNKTFKKSDTGISSFRAGGLMILLIVLFCFGIGNIYIGINRIRFNVSLYPFLIVLAITFLFNYYLLFRHDKYLKYFKEFEKMDKKNKMIWAWISLGVIFGIFGFSIGSFVFMIDRL